MAKKPNIEPLGENVLIEPAKSNSKTASGIVLPDTSEEKPQEGVVIAVGMDKKIKVKAGQKVIYSKYSGNEIKIGEAEYLLVKNEDILAIVK
ncbi:MAG: co-chaperonin GroES, chaperonin GroES [Candidatus Moranbacteria bacterium GW2011_GWC1_45_18]|nr:MAG: 10 kDa chaperonin [Candidatus Moranbacteria bacterium GW2011_GWC2_40_12]KKT33736.1 MAG: 10 kDa chaperonin [Candidatus Moranbacteria bacterium GW2011_GWF2_44_10]KKU00090.1 MAG: co-chaperonin GroES, chaperonin GroES [Candidatus Moranbacteria bacterium GW2011_GWC1_45_18]OGI22273.1 MAG: co-chaperone GroES [Candidatus Moranbacteria bacterium RIFOXYA1_FULL_44_8]OGI36399.1 MAG: co-chaperone GroES [Candidatus Moranbacteria bacterium RIFOXYC1_FULL_44_8]OGI39333.1 MAG: co-chaperone GroES [Candid